MKPPLTRLGEMISKALSCQTLSGNSFHYFLIEAMKLFLTIPNRINFLQMGKSVCSSGQSFLMNFRKDCEKTPGAGYFWTGGASAVKWGFEFMGFEPLVKLL
ncbi:MAG: hypothetical protein ACI399_02240 [Candidatus Cryptobacteroides sp.]